MISVEKPDYSNTPASDSRAEYGYAPRVQQTPILSIITPYYNTGQVFWETFRSIQRMSFVYWEWIIVDDESTDQGSLIQLDRARSLEPRIRVIRQSNGGPAVARNRAAREAQGRYLLMLDSDDMVEPTFAEKAMWFLETQPQTFAAVNAYNVTFGAKNLLWPHGFDHGSENIYENFCTIQSVVRASAYLSVGGFDERVSYQHADWDFWLTLAESGLWGHTLPEYLTWYRTQERSLLREIESDRERSARFRKWLHEKHHGLSQRFPRPQVLPAGLVPASTYYASVPFENPLATGDSTRSVLFIVPWLEVGGADQLNLDAIRELTAQGYRCTIVTTMRNHTPWLSRFTAVTPDVFCLHDFLNLADHPRFISYLIDSRQIDAIVVSNSELGYALLPYLRAKHPHVAVLDYTHMEDPELPDGGYPGKSVAASDLLDIRMTNTQHLKEWMMVRGVPSQDIEVRRCAIDVAAWRPSGEARARTRAVLQIADDMPLIAFVGRMSAQKRPLMFAKILAELARHGVDFAGVAVGDGPELPRLRRALRYRGLTHRVMTLGALGSEASREILQAADILLLPSAMEGLAFVLIEAMALGAVPVAAQVGGQAELVTPESGYLIERNDNEVAQYAIAVLKLIADATFRRKMAQEARRCVERTFTMESLSVGIRESIDHAIVIASTRTNLEEPHAAELARAIVSQMAPQDAHEARWLTNNRQLLHARLRQARQVVLPVGSRRYGTYEQLRKRLQGKRIS